MANENPQQMLGLTENVRRERGLEVLARRACLAKAKLALPDFQTLSLSAYIIEKCKRICNLTGDKFYGVIGKAESENSALA